MSIVISGVPLLLLSLVAPQTLEAVSELFSRRNVNTDSQGYSASYSIDCETMKKMREQKIQTNIVDKDTLIKTLREYGSEYVYEENEEIICKYEDFKLTFSKVNPKDAYILDLQYAIEDSPVEMLGEISDEYNKNVQEISYNKIKERLEAKNMEINEEEILEDDTIVLTVNLE
ncbi:MAG: hypothetical protein IKR34_05795 [Candidatus Gastranaerophilales bacterium]|nr:hypothetical protein [Candidatus Gastranaerophilales bacterium]